MADSIYKWSLTAASNDGADSIINWRENQLPDTVNNSARAMMQRVAEWREDLTGSLVTTGTQPAYTLTTNAQFDTLTNGRFINTRIHASNSGVATLNVNGLGAIHVRKFSLGGDIELSVGDLQLGGLYTMMYSSSANSGAGAWLINNPSSASGGAGIQSGTVMLFAMATAPTGWTKQTTQNDKTIRVVSGTTGGTAGGNTAFSTVFTSTRTVTGTVDGTAITAAQMPVHAHTQQGSFNTGAVSNDHSHAQTGTFGSGGRSTAHQHAGVSDGSNFVAAGGSLGSGSGLGYRQVSNTNYDDRDHSHNTGISGNTGGISANHTHAVSISGATTNAGSGAAHVHTFTSGNADFAVQYVDMIIATKD